MNHPPKQNISKIEITKNKKKIIVLNKCDLADDRQNKLWVEHFNKKGIPAVLTDSNSGRGIDECIREIEKIMKVDLEAQAEKGRKDLSSIEFTYLASMMLSGEELINENAVINRSNISWYSRSNFTKEGSEAIDYLVRNDRGNELLRRFSLTLYTQILKRYSTDYIRKIYNKIRELFKFEQITDDRIRNTAIYTMLGILEIENAFKQLGVDTSSVIDRIEAKEMIERNLLENVMDAEEEGQLAEYEEVLLLIDKIAGIADMTLLISHGEHYKREYDHVYLDLNDIWDKLNIYMTRYIKFIKKI